MTIAKTMANILFCSKSLLINKYIKETIRKIGYLTYLYALQFLFFNGIFL